MTEQTRSSLAAAPGVTAPAARPGAGPVIPAAVRKVVDAFVGEWKFEVAVMLPGATEPRMTRTTFSGTPVACGYGVQCLGYGDMGELGRYEEATLASYDLGEGVVRFMNITSLGQVNDFRGTWTSDQTITFAPLQTVRMGKPATVCWSITWTDADSMSFAQVTTLEDGTTSSLSAVGKRQ